MNIIYICMAVFILSFLSVYTLTPFVIRFARKTNFIDNPNSRKVHVKATPLLGGVSVFIGFFIMTCYLVITKQHVLNIEIIGYLVAALIIVIVGIVDDKYGMNPILKLVGQLLSCLIFLISNDLLTILGPIYVTLPLLILWMVGLMNAMNFLDNMDGIITGMSGILSKQLEFAGDADYISLLSLIFAGSVLGFLPYNFNPAKIFLGDAGSMFIGYFLASMGILSGKLAVTRMNNDLYYLLPVLLLSFAIFDISLVSFTRKRDGRKISQGGKDHSTHRIGTALGSSKITAFIVYLINIIIVLVTIIVYIMGSEILLIASTVIFALLFLFFGRKLDQIPIVVPQNQLKEKEDRS